MSESRHVHVGSPSQQKALTLSGRPVHGVHAHIVAKARVQCCTLPTQSSGGRVQKALQVSMLTQGKREAGAYP